MKKRFCLVSLAFLISTTMSFSESMLKIVSDQQESDIYINGKFAAKYTGSNVIVTLPEGKYKLEMRKDMDDGSYYHFEKQYELGEYSVRVTAEAKMEQILTEKYYYLRAKKNGNIFDYEDYIKKYPSGKYAADFSKELEELYYQNALRKNTVEAYQKYAEKYSKGKYMGEIKEKLDKLSPKGIVDVIPKQFKKGDEITIYFDVSKSQDIWKYRKILKKNKPEIPLEPEKIFVRYGFNGWEEKYLKLFFPAIKSISYKYFFRF